MGKFVNDILGMVPEADLIETGFMVSRPNDPLDALFTNEQTNNLMAKWHTLAAQFQIPQMAQFHAFDVESQKTIHTPVDHHNVTKGLIKVKRNTSELLRELLQSGVTAESEIYDFVTDDNANLSDQVVTRANVARAEMMATGQVTIKENGLDLTVDYGVPAANKAHTLDVGEGAATDILSQIEVIVQAARNNGVVLTGMICPRSFLTKLRNNTAVQKAINGNIGAGAMVRTAALEAFLDDEFGISQVVVDDLTYSLPYTMSNGEPAATVKRYFPTNKVSFFGAVNGMKLGSGLWGVPPEVDIARFYEVGGSTRSPYVYVTQWAESDPAVIWTKASALYMPVLYAPQSLYIATVSETPGA